MLGGLARRTALVEKLCQEGPLLAVDSGDLLFAAGADSAEQAQSKARVIARAYRRMGVAAVNVGDLDLLQGLDFLRGQAPQGLPLISANLLVDGKAVFPPYVIREISGMRIAFLGLLSPAVIPEAQKMIDGKAQISDPLEAARQVLSRIRGRADLVIVLSDLGQQANRQLLRAVPEIHFVLGGHEGLFQAQPSAEGGGFSMQSSAKGMYVGKLQVQREGKGPYRDRGKERQLRDQIGNLERRIQTLQREKMANPRPEIEQQIGFLNAQRDRFSGELKRASALSGNSFLWTLLPLDPAMPQDEEVRSWIREAGIEKD